MTAQNKQKNQTIKKTMSWLSLATISSAAVLLSASAFRGKPGYMQKVTPPNDTQFLKTHFSHF